MDPPRRMTRRRRRPTGLFAFAWVVVGIMLVSQVRLPEPPAAAATPDRAACWIVHVASAPAGERSLARALRRLRRSGLPAAIWWSKHWGAVRPGTRALVVPFERRAAARAARSRLANIGFTHAVVRRLPAAACRR
jgi:SPOR domain